MGAIWPGSVTIRRRPGDDWRRSGINIQTGRGEGNPAAGSGVELSLHVPAGSLCFDRAGQPARGPRMKNKVLLTSEEMKEEHPAEWSLIEHGKHFTPPDRVTINGRQKIFFPVAALIMAAFSFGVFRFVSVEKTAITTVPLQETSVAYVPQTPTPRPTPTITPTPPPAGAVAENTWKGFYEGLFRNRCGNCHGFTAVSGLTLKTYQSAVKGGKSGPGIVPGKADSSEIVIIQSKGNHPGQLSKDELQQVIDWINSGAPEQ